MNYPKHDLDVVLNALNFPHKSLTFIVKDHAKILRGKSRMIIDYRRLNDNDAYNILDRDYFLSYIQTTKYFSKFDYKSGFHQIKISEPSVP